MRKTEAQRGEVTCFGSQLAGSGITHQDKRPLLTVLTKVLHRVHWGFPGGPVAKTIKFYIALCLVDDIFEI